MHPIPVPPKLTDMTGQVFNRLTVIGYGHSYYNGNHLRHKWLCQCSCGNQILTTRTELRHNRTKSCGCFTKDRLTTHGHSKGGVMSPTYRSWKSMMDRCYRKTDPSYHRYGALGVYVYEPWHDFQKFLDYMGERPKGKTIDRYPKIRGNYVPGNVRWGTPREQTLGRTTTVWIKVDGKTMCRTDWARELGIAPKTLTQKGKKIGNAEAVRFYRGHGPERGPNKRPKLALAA